MTGQEHGSSDKVTDAYLVLLATRHKGVLATMDEALAAIHPGVFLLPRYS